MQYTLKQISQHLDAKVINEPSVEVIISWLNYAEQAKENDLTLIDNKNILSSGKIQKLLLLL